MYVCVREREKREEREERRARGFDQSSLKREVGPRVAVTMPQMKVTPVYGAGKNGALCSVLKIDDDVTLLLDCGWDDLFDVKAIKNLAEVAPSVTHVLVSHPDLLHLGALPYAKKHFGLDATVYATLPVHKMGQMYLYDQYLSRQAVEDFNLFSLDDVDAAFSSFKTLQYSQTVDLGTKGKKVLITPFNAGHLVGGTVWRINVDGEDVVYAVDINHRKDRHLNGANLEQIFDKPALMITSGSSSLNQPVNKQVRDRDFVNSIMQTLRNGGNVLLPVDTAGRVLELICLLERHWQQNKLGGYQLFLLTSVAYNTMEFAKSQLEWMNTAFTTSFEHSRTNAFSTKFMKICHSKEELNKLSRGPRVVMASLSSMESGPARDLLVDWAMLPKNLIIFTQNPVADTLAHKLQTAFSGTIRIQVSRRIPLVGKELEEHEASKKMQIKQEDEKFDVKANENADSFQVQSARTASGALTRLSSNSNMSPAIAKATHGFKDVLIEGFVPDEECAGPLFPFRVKSVERDEYGEAFDESHYKMLVVEEGDAAATDQDDMEVEVEIDDRPTKVVNIGMTLHVRATVMFLDYEGKSDSYSMKMIIGNVGPRELAVVSGTRDAVDTLVKGVKVVGVNRVYAPDNLTYVNISSLAVSSLSMKMSDDLLRVIQLQKIGNYSVAWVQGQVEKGEEEGEHILMPVEKKLRTQHAAAFVGDFRLGDLRQDLVSKGIKTELVQGVLVCDDSISIQRMGAKNEIVIQGPLSANYYMVRDILNRQFQICN